MNEDDLRAKHYVKNSDGSWSKTSLPVGSLVVTPSLTSPEHISEVQATKPMTAAAHNAPQVGHSQLHPSDNPLVEVSRPGRPLAAEGKRIRQGEPKLNKWETEWKFILEIGGWSHIRAQSIRVRLGNGSWYKGDVSAVNQETGRIHVWEVKGDARMKGVAKGILALKVAASQYPEICWTLVWKERGAWKQQEVLP